MTYLLPENRRQLSVCKGQSPQSKVGGSVGHHAQHELDRFDGVRGIEGGEVEGDGRIG